MKCQMPDCQSKAVWRLIDKYIQPGQARFSKHPFTYFYYMCDEHKENFGEPTVGHVKEFEKI